MADDFIRIFSLNCWGLKYVSKDRAERISAICDFLAASQYDIVCLQELWIYRDYEAVKLAVARRLGYAKFFYSGALGAGLAIFSRFPIIAATIQPYSLNGSPADVKAGDWFVGKAAASVLIAHPVLGQVQVFNTHLFAKGGEGGPEYHRAHRLVNAWEFAKLAKQSAEIGRYVIAAGDFNSIPVTLPMTVIRDHAGLNDAWESVHPSPDPATSPSIDPKDAIAVYGVTADSPLNSYSAGKPLDSYARFAQGKRLDYILFRDPPHSRSGVAQPTLMCLHARVVLTDLVPGCGFSYSDHFGLEATLSIQHPEAKDHTPLADLAPEATTMVHALRTCLRHSATRAGNEMTIFGSCLALDIFLIAAASIWRTIGLTSFFVLLGTISTWLGTTMLYVGFVYGRWEVNALQNVIEELELYVVSIDAVGSRELGAVDLYRSVSRV
ncbi:inositol phosphophingolipids phospholipase C [Vararia minispora EC-137]|uniref:Inositol phosphophingolipids phospholipase C n=1 Tax=Vararia minispora EC-137 TaxID=1314806 RepID=A0ACB8QKB7_9AGAM|nr:inositol phosphophingolipids phospholipase C [Vararia minispora EC-137]